MQQNATIPATTRRPNTTTPAPIPMATGDTPVTETPGVDDEGEFVPDVEGDEDDEEEEDGDEEKTEPEPVG
jgi:hypothetical protein